MLQESVIGVIWGSSASKLSLSWEFLLPKMVFKFETTQLSYRLRNTIHFDELSAFIYGMFHNYL